MKPLRTGNNPYPERCGVIWVRGKLGNFKIRTIGDLHDYIEAVKGAPPKALGSKMYERKMGGGAIAASHLVAGDCLCGLDIDKVCKGYDLKPPAHYKYKGGTRTLSGPHHFDFVYRFDEDESGKKLLPRSMKGLHFLPLPRKIHLHEDLQDNLRRPAVALQRQGSSRKARGVLQIPRDEAGRSIRLARSRTR